MKGSLKIMAACALTAAVASCKSLPAEMLEGEWNAVSISGQHITPSDETPFLGFDMTEGRLYGFNGCNRVMGNFDVKSLLDGKVDFSNMGSTMMACPDNQYEQLFTKAAAEARKMELLEDGSLAFFNEKKDTLMKMTKRVFTPETLEGEWNVVEIRGEMIEPSEETPFMGFKVADKQIYGFTGCNRITGTADFAKIVAGESDFANLGTTRMACADDQYEAKFLQALNEAKKVSMGYKIFSLLDEEGHTLLTFQKR